MGAVPNVKVTMQFALGSVGWTESHLYVGANINDAAVYTDMLALAAARVNCLGGNVRFLLVKASQEQVNRDVRYLKRGDIPLPTGGTYSGGPGAIGGGIWSWQTPHVSWPLKLTDNNANQLAITYLAGMPAAINQIGPGPYDVSNGSTPGGKIQLYADYLVSGGKWGVAGRGWPAGNFTLATSTPMTALPTSQPSQGPVPATISFTVPSPVNGVALVPGVWIRVGGLKYVAPQKRLRLNGTYQVYSYAAGVATVLVPRLRAGPVFTPGAFGYMQAAAYAFYPYQAYTIDDITHKKRGRVVSSPAGRRSTGA